MNNDEVSVDQGERDETNIEIMKNQDEGDEGCEIDHEVRINVKKKINDEVIVVTVDQGETDETNSGIMKNQDEVEKGCEIGHEVEEYLKNYVFDQTHDGDEISVQEKAKSDSNNINSDISQTSNNIEMIIPEISTNPENIITLEHIREVYGYINKLYLDREANLSEWQKIVPQQMETRSVIFENKINETLTKINERLFVIETDIDRINKRIKELKSKENKFTKEKETEIEKGLQNVKHVVGEHQKNIEETRLQTNLWYQEFLNEKKIHKEHVEPALDYLNELRYIIRT